MASRNDRADAISQRRPRSRKSVAHMPSPDKENMTEDVGATLRSRKGLELGEKTKKKSRSKSIGPGGLDALGEDALNRRKIAAAVAVKSILKPTIPLSPLREIPARSAKREEARKVDQNRPTDNPSGSSVPVIGADMLANPFDGMAHSGSTDSVKVDLRTEEQQQAAARDREEQEKRESEKKEILERREARRKSLANRRVSFAPEATLHTWDVVEVFQDSTTSSASTISSRRASSASTASMPDSPHPRPQAQLPSSDPPSTPPEQVEEPRPNHSPCHQRDLHQKKRRRSSGIPPMNFNDPNDVFSSSPYSDGSAGTAEDSEMSMDITRVVGGIVPQEVVPGPANASPLGDETMDLTVAFGQIQGEMAQTNTFSAADEDEELSMEFTTIMGGMLPSSMKSLAEPLLALNASDQKAASPRTPHGSLRRQSMASNEEESEMDMTVAVGEILPPTLVQPPYEDQTMDMDMDITTAVGGILPVNLTPMNKSQAKKVMEREVDSSNTSPIVNQAMEQTPTKRNARTKSPKADIGTPNRSKGRTRSATRKETTGRNFQQPKSPLKQSLTPIKGPTTPTKQVTPEIPQRPKTPPGKTPPPKGVALRSSSPRKLFKDEIREARATPKSSSAKNLFKEDPHSGALTPSVVLTPRSRRLSGLGIDKQGLGSPSAAAILDRRRSIGEVAGSFTPTLGDLKGSRKLRFDDPSMMEMEIDNEHEEEDRRQKEDQQNRAKSETKDATINLREMIQSLTPKKKLKGRKSLHVGAAKGILGKRPAELDEEDEDEDAKRAKGLEGSPVKSIGLAPPGSKTEMTGRIVHGSRQSLGEMSANVRSQNNSPQASKTATPRKRQSSKTAESAHDEEPHETLTQVSDETDENEQEEKIHLQEFLNMTSIRFMDLTTTKRRHTMAPTAKMDPDPTAYLTDPEKGMESARDLQSCVVAGACTIPMLELYQHSCRELKRYISEGRSIVREIEADTFEANPPLFREYMSASSDVRFIMDNQFKNVKTNARLQSKAMWYEWRMKLLEGLKEGLSRINQDMDVDEETISKQENIILPIVSPLVQEHGELATKQATLEAQADELANCDQEELRVARNTLANADREIEEKMRSVKDIKKNVDKVEQSIKAGADTKNECLEEIKEAERVREECRGWSGTEVGALKAKADALEEKSGWAITSANGTRLTTTFRKELQLVFDVTSFNSNDGASKPSIGNLPVEISYIGHAREVNPVAFTPEKQYFVQAIRNQLLNLEQNTIKMKDFMAFVSSSWTIAGVVTEEMRQLCLHYPTLAAINDNSTLSVRSTLLLPKVATKVKVSFEIESNFARSDSPIAVTANAIVAYGERYNQVKMVEFLNGSVSQGIRAQESEERGSWRKAVQGLEERLIARGKK
ncbi:MAG: hypothetical protein M1833_005352 [Piccolia ochrophora]|nr:MAG: hypothetical protein M1833_005352 [Piccolia ochrophora]